MMGADPFERAWAEAAELGVCPVCLVEGFYKETCDFDTLCDAFECDECVATPEDMGWRPDDEGAARDGRGREEESLEIPF